jgi:hypothetical protein
MLQLVNVPPDGVTWNVLQLQAVLLYASFTQVPTYTSIINALNAGASGTAQIPVTASSCSTFQVTPSGGTLTNCNINLPAGLCK